MNANDHYVFIVDDDAERTLGVAWALHGGIRLGRRLGPREKAGPGGRPHP